MDSHITLPASNYRGRLAPSPTGYLHVGHARTFWTAYERARDAGGVLVMRMDDLDPDRSRDAYAEAALEDLRWLGIRWQEGPDLTEPESGGPFAPYEQSKRQPVYLEAWRKLLRGGFIYPCRCSRKDLEAALSAPHESFSAGANGLNSSAEFDPLDDEPVYPGTCRPSANNLRQTNEVLASEIAQPNNCNWRFRVPDEEVIEFVDRNLGLRRFVAGKDFGDFVVWRRDGIPSYQLACAADDAAMKITEVVRGEDLLKSTARQILINRALGFENPGWFHCRLVVDRNGCRLAKRHDALSLRALRLRGVAPMNALSAELPMEGL
jgi:glutamyl-tRNA synthetase